MKIIFIFSILLTYTSAMASSCPPNMDKKALIDQFVSRSVDVDGDGLPDNIELHIKGNNFYSPFKWELKIYSKNKIIYKRNGSNERIDKFFSNANYIAECSDYDDCKCWWYFQGFLNRVIVKIGPDNVGIFDKTAPNSIYVVAKRALKKESKKNPRLVEKAIKNAVDRLSYGKAVIISIFDEPEVHTPPMIWMPEFNRFVPVYEQ